MKQPSLMRNFALSLVLLASAMPAFVGQTAFERAFDKIWNRDKLTGDWGGLRSNLSKHGIDIGLRLS
jgi:carbohydrate-selective porin OprB